MRLRERDVYYLVGGRELSCMESVGGDIRTTFPNCLLVEKSFHLDGLLGCREAETCMRGRVSAVRSQFHCEEIMLGRW